MWWIVAGVMGFGLLVFVVCVAALLRSLRNLSAAARTLRVRVSMAHDLAAALDDLRERGARVQRALESTSERLPDRSDTARHRRAG